MRRRASWADGSWQAEIPANFPITMKMRGEGSPALS